MSERRNQRKKWETERWFPKLPQVEIIDLKTTEKTFTLIKPFNKVLRMLPAIRWTAGSWSWDLFGGGAALSPGIEMLYDDVTMTPEKIKDNFEMKKYWFDGEPKIDQDPASKQVVFPGRYSFNREVPKGLDLTGRHKLELQNNQDMSALGGTDSVIKLIFKGWTYSYD